MALIFDGYNSITASTVYTSDTQVYSVKGFPDDSPWVTSSGTGTVVLQWTPQGLVWIPPEPEAASEHALVNQLLDLLLK